MGRLADRVAIITGAGGGIGRATALLMAQRGATLVIQDINGEGVEQTASEITGMGGTALTDVSDIARVEDCRRLVERAEEAFGRVDILVNNAGIGLDTTIEEATEASFDRMMAVHVKGSFFCAQAAVAGMKQRRYGRIVNTSSRWALAGHEKASDYIAAKSAILGFTKAWAKELAPYGITVNAIAPGGVITAMVMQNLGAAGVAAEAALVPLGRWVEPGEMAFTTAFLASDEASFITGQVVSPNGGKTMVGF